MITFYYSNDNYCTFSEANVDEAFFEPGSTVLS
jgi:hypothetical protein